MDIGGTFTDIVAYEETTRRFSILKVPSTPANYMLGMENGLRQLLATKDVAAANIHLFYHGTTVGTNTVLEQKGAPTGLLTTLGFRDILEIGRTARSPVDLYDLQMDRITPLVPRCYRLGVRERMNARGEAEVPLDEDAVRLAAEVFAGAGIQSVAVCFINSYANPLHEEQARDILLKHSPHLYVALSADVNPQYREYERSSTTVLSAYIGPRVSRYTDQLGKMLESLGLQCRLHIMQASGGAMTAEAVQRNAIRTVLSGPAAGVLGVANLSHRLDEANVVGFDMGGTSTDVSLIRDGAYRIVEERQDLGHYLRMPMIDISTIGAGGGSIAWIDSGGVLKVGPRSAGADPGPACYGKGEEATITDANLALGYIDPGYFLGGQIELDLERARRAIRDRIANPLSLSLDQAAYGILRVANSNMIRAIKRVTVERGHDVL
ncbi:MAG: hydantoinase/oxoprolinase family protein, partial [Chloroflexota bacterium]